MGAGAAIAGTGVVITLAVPMLLGGLLAATTAAAAAEQPSPVTLGPGVPEAYRGDVLAAAALCPRISPSILAAQTSVESDWNPRASTPTGGHGIAGLTDAAWARWGGDLDEDGDASVLDPGDAIRAQALAMCQLLDTITAGGLGDDDPVAVISLALAGYYAGIDAVLARAGIPTAAQAYVTQVWAAATSGDYALGIAEDTDTPRPDVPAGGVDALLPAGYTNGRSATQAVAYALTQVGVWRDAGYCLRFVGRAVYQRPYDGGSIDYAHQVWDNAPNSLHHPRDYGAPRGAILLWSSAIGGGSGHIAISLGSGTMITTTRGAVAIRRIAGFADHAYLGWMPPYFRSQT